MGAEIWTIAAPFITLAVRAWVAAIHDEWKRISVGAIDWRDKARAVLIVAGTSLPRAVQTAFRDFPFGTLANGLLKLIKR